MFVYNAMALAEIRHAELLEEAAQNRQTRPALRPHRSGKGWGQVVRDAVLALCGTGISTPKTELTNATHLAPAAEST